MGVVWGEELDEACNLSLPPPRPILAERDALKIVKMPSAGRTLIALLLPLASASALRVPPPSMGASSVSLVDVDLAGGKTIGVFPAWPVWPAEQALARVMAHAPSLCRGKRVLELGCGLGAIGLACAASGAFEVLLTDAEEPMVACARGAVAAHGFDNVHVAVLDWADAEQLHALRQSCFDIIVAADVLYDESAPALVANLLATLIVQPGTRALIADPAKRPYRTAFDIALMERGMRMEEGPLPGPDGMRLLSITRMYMA